MDKNPLNSEELEDASQVGELLSKLTDNQFRFWELMNDGKLGQREAYRLAYGCEEWSNNAISVQATRLWNNPKFVLIRQALKNTVVEQAARSLNYRIAEMESFAERCEGAGQYGAAGKARENAAKLEGHYVIKTQSVPSRSDDLCRPLVENRQRARRHRRFAMELVRDYRGFEFYVLGTEI